jgi:Ca-activated chloride channel family protein
MRPEDAQQHALRSSQESASALNPVRPHRPCKRYPQTETAMHPSLFHRPRALLLTVLAAASTAATALSPIPPAAGVAPAIAAPPVVPANTIPLATPLATPTAPSITRFRSPQAETPIQLQSYRQQVSIAGQTVMTRLTLQFHNPNARVLEGELQFPLQDGQAITGFALDIDGELRRAVPVAKTKGLQVFEEIVRGRVDPALLEATAGNQYKLRVYPLPARGSRTVQLDITQTLAATGPGPTAERLLKLPIGFDGPIGRAELAVHLAGVAPAALKATPLGLPAGALRIGDAPDGGSLVQLPARALERPAAVQLRISAADRNTPMAMAAHFDGQQFVYAELPLPRVSAPRPAPKRLALVWDASGSGAQRQRTAEFALLDALFARWPDLRIRLYVLRDQLEAPVEIDVRGGRWAALRTRLQHEAFDGATQLGAVHLPADAADLALLFSDGQSTFGAPQPPSFGMPAFVLQSSPGSHAAVLRPLAEASGGAVLDLQAMDSAQAAQRVATETARLAELRSADGADWVASSAGTGAGRVAIAGIAHAPNGVLKARFSLPGGGQQVLRVRWRSAPQAEPGTSASRPAPGHHVPRAELRRAAAEDGNASRGTGVQHASRPPWVDRSGGAPGTAAAAPLSDDSAPPLPALRWAMLQLDALAVRPELHRRAIEQLGRRFGLATSETSLIVLETLGDYVRHRIEPPVGPLRTAWRQQATQISQQDQRGQQQRVERLVQRWRERETWWATDFPKDAPKPLVRQEQPAPPIAALGRLRDRAASADTKDLNELGKSAEAAPASPRPAPVPAIVPAPALAGAATRPAEAMPLASAAALPERRAAGPAQSAEAELAGSASIALKPWRADTPSARRLRAAAPVDRYAVYLDERAHQLKSPAFFLDAADLFFAQNDVVLGLRVLSNLAEMALENRQLLRILGYRLLQAQRADLAVPVFERVLDIAPHEPQSSRDLGLALADAGRWQPAVQQLWQTALHAGAAAGRFPDIDLTALAEMNALVATAARQGRPVDTAGIDPRLLKNLQLGLRVVLGWDADNTDIDLHVTDPDGQVAFYGQPRTRQGGRMSADFTGGYGPEEFALRKPKPGVYTVRAHFFGHRQQLLAPATSLMLRLATGFGTAAEREQRVMLRLSGAGENVLVGEFRVDPPAD